MIVLFLASVASLCAGAAVTLIFGLIEAALPTLAVFAIAYFFLARSVSKKMEKAMLQVQSELQKQRIDRGIAILQDIKKRFAKWQFFTQSALDGQIGSIYYLRQDFARAKPYLEKSFGRHWVARAMLGVLHYRKKEYDKMNTVFESASKYSAKQGLLWSIWAYCLSRAGKNDMAINVLLRGQKKLGGSDPRIGQNLKNLQNKKRMKMRSYGEQWYQFHLEMSPQMRQVRGGAVKYARR